MLIYLYIVKSEANPSRVILLKSDNATGPFERITAFDESMKDLEEGLYEAPTAFKTSDGKWCLMLDFYGCGAEGQGYIPFLSNDISTGIFTRADNEFSFPYGFLLFLKHLHSAALSLPRLHYQLYLPGVMS